MLLVFQIARQQMGSKKTNPLQWEIKHSKYRYWREPKSSKLCASSIYHLEKAEQMPFHERISFSRTRGTSSAHQFPVERFLMRQVGRDYDIVFSELLARIPEKYRDTINIDEFIMSKNKRTKEIQKGFNLRTRHYLRHLYVEVDSNVICYNPPVGVKKARKEDREKSVFRPFKNNIFKYSYFTEKHSFTQLTTYADFEKEAKEMHHCIRSYWYNCVDAQYKTSIWSLEIANKKTLTIQITDSKIVQVRGVRNRLPTFEEGELIGHWAKKIACKISDYYLLKMKEAPVTQ